EPPDIVDEVDHAHLHRRPGDADRADEEVHLVLLRREDVLDAGANFRFKRIGAARRLRYRLIPRSRRWLVEQAFAQARAFVSRGAARVPAAGCASCRETVPST